MNLDMRLSEQVQDSFTEGVCGRKNEKNMEKQIMTERQETSLRDRRRQMQKKRRQYQRIRLIIQAVILFLACVGAVTIVKTVVRKLQGVQETGAVETEVEKYIPKPPDFQVELLSINEYSRPGTALEQVNGIVIHWTANPETTAEQNRNYFEGLAQSKETYASSHFVIGLEGEIIQCIPCNEIAYASNERNSDTIAIECCTEDDTGKFNKATYQALTELVTWLMGRYDLEISQVIRHYDVTGKDCPKYYVEHEDAWQQMREDFLQYIEANGIAKNEKIN